MIMYSTVSDESLFSGIIDLTYGQSMLRGSEQVGTPETKALSRTKQPCHVLFSFILLFLLCKTKILKVIGL